MAKLLKFLGKKAPHPPRPDYSGGARKGKGSVSDSDDEPQHSLPAYLTESPPVHGSPGHTLDRLRHASQSSQDSGTGMESSNTQATCPISPTKQKPIICDDYSDPKDVLRAVKDGGYQIPAEGPIPDKPYVEDDYSVPYEAQKLIQQMRMDKEVKLKSRKTVRNISTEEPLM
ncbi:uncharacterized protein [Amphiura filiformis]|uniref:uncharacterized protein n=1 Tax=Amphiura filiformis TaxID=82378 RepID=UPI003B21A7CD